MSRSQLVAQLSDLYCGSPFFDGELLASAVRETMALDPADEMEADVASRPIQETVVRFRSLLRQEPVAKVLNVLA